MIGVFYPTVKAPNLSLGAVYCSLTAKNLSLGIINLSFEALEAHYPFLGTLKLTVIAVNLSRNGLKLSNRAQRANCVAISKILRAKKRVSRKLFRAPKEMNKWEV